RRSKRRPARTSKARSCRSARRCRSSSRRFEKHCNAVCLFVSSSVPSLSGISITQKFAPGTFWGRIVVSGGRIAFFLWLRGRLLTGGWLLLLRQQELGGEGPVLRVAVDIAVQ